MPRIVLATLNARYSHASLGLRCLRANLGELRNDCEILEFEARQEPPDIAAAILDRSPRIVGLGVYVWNARACLEAASLLKRVRPETVLVLGGPEVSYEVECQPICQLADYVIRGEGDLAFADLCRRILAGRAPERAVIAPEPPPLDRLCPPYGEYTGEDLAHRVIYVEASRGCPFRCQFCLSALDVPVRQAPVEPFLDAIGSLLDRGARQLKFVDRTFNLNLRVVRRILEFLLVRYQPGMFFHFEMIPDRLPAETLELLARFPPGSIQLEVGIQTFNEAVCEKIDRRQDASLVEKNLGALRQLQSVHVHADLIAGLPGEDWESFARGFDRLFALGPEEIQVGILKRLRGAPIVRHEQEHGMVFSPFPPYEVLKTGELSYGELVRLKRFARTFDYVANSGRFLETAAAITDGGSPFERYLGLADRMQRTAGRVFAIGLHRWAEEIYLYATEDLGLPPRKAGGALAADYARAGRGDLPGLLRPYEVPRQPGAVRLRQELKRQDRRLSS